MKTKTRSALTLVLFALYFLLLAGVILFKLPFYSPLGAELRVINLVPFGGSFNGAGDFLLREVLYNILLFVPLGIYLPTLKPHWSLGKKVLTIFTLTFTFEALQFIFALGRSDVTDLLNNSLGGLLGLGIYALLHKLLKEKTDPVVTLLALVVTLPVLAWFCYLFTLSHFVMRH